MSNPATVRFSTDAFPERERFQAWREMVGRNLQRVETERLSDAPFRVTMTVSDLPGLRVHTETRTPLRIARTRALLVDGDDSLALGISTGAGVASWLGREFAFGPGEPVLLPSGEISAFTHPSPSQGVYLCIRRNALRPLVSDANAIPLGRLGKDRAALSLLKHYVGVLQNDRRATATPELQRLAASHIHDLLALMLGAPPEAAKAGLGAARLSAIKSDIAASLSHPDLTIKTVAQRHRISPRYVQMLFESEETTFSDFVRRRRLERAHTLLSDSRYGHLSVSQIAYEVGFGDLSHFNHSFRKLYGLSPSQARADRRRPQG